MRTTIHIAFLTLFLSAGLGCQQMGTFVDRLNGKNPTWALKKMQDPYFPDERREGIYYLSDQSFGRRPPWTTRYQQIAQDDTDYTVRAAAVRSLNRARDKTATPVFIAALSDRNDLVRLEGAKALANVPDPKSVGPLTKIVSNPVEGRDLRIAAADALRHYRDLGAARSLVSVLNGKDFGLAWQARHSLRTLTGHDLKYDEGAWLTYLTTQNPFS